MSYLIDLPLEIITHVLDLSNLDKEMLRCTCKLLYDNIPWSNLLYDDPINSPYSLNQLPFLISKKKDNINNLAENAIKRNRVDLLDILKPLSSNGGLEHWGHIAAMNGNMDTYQYIYNFNTPDDRISDPYFALRYGNMNIFNFLEEKGSICSYEDKVKNVISYGAIKSGKLEIVIEIYNRGYSFSQNCIQEATNVDIMTWLYNKGFIANKIHLNAMAHKRNLEGIKWFFEVKIVSCDVICDICLSNKFINGVKFLLNNEYKLSHERNKKYDYLIEWYSSKQEII